MKVRRDNFLVIQGWMVTELKLKGVKRDIFAIIYGFNQDGESRFSGSASYLAEWTGTSRSTVMRSLKELVEDQLLNKHDTEVNGVKFCEYSINETGCIKMTQGVYQNDTGGCVKMTHNNIVNNIEDNIDKKDTKKDFSEDVEEIYKLYPAKCPIGKRSTGKTKKNKDKIKGLLKKDYTFDQLSSIIKRYIKECMQTDTYIKNFSTFLNNIPDYGEVPDIKLPTEKLYTYVVEGSGQRNKVTEEIYQRDLRLCDASGAKMYNVMIHNERN